MCQFFSFCSINGKPLFFNAEQRRKILNYEGEFRGFDYETDSHTSIADFFGYKGEKEDKLNKYEYNPISKIFVIDGIGNINDSLKMKRWVKNLDFKTIVPELIIKPIINPFKIEPPKITEKHIELLKQWASGWNSAWHLDKVSLMNSVCYSTHHAIDDSAWYSIGGSIEDLVGDLIWASVTASVKDLLWGSVKDSIWAYVSSFFDIWNGKNPYQSCIDLWEMGLVPAKGGKIWYLVSKNGIEWKASKEEK